MTVLIIDDEWVNRELYKEFLTPAGYKVEMAEDGLEGLNKAIWMSPDFILLDFRLPKKDGGQVYRELKGNEVTKDIPVIIISAHSTPSFIAVKCPEIPFGDIYKKPINHRAIKERIDKALKVV